MEIDRFIKFLAEERVSRLLYEKNAKEGNFEEYPEKRELFDIAVRNEINKFISENPESIGILKFLKSKSKENMEAALSARKEEIAESDKFVLDDINFILDNTYINKDEDVRIGFDDKRYQIIKLILEARCSEQQIEFLEGSKHMRALLKEANPEVIQSSLEVAQRVDNSDSQKGNIAELLAAQIAKFGLRLPNTYSEGPDER